MRITTIKILFLAVTFLLLQACNGTKFVADGEVLLTHNHITSTDPEVHVSHLGVYLSQQPNSKWFSLLKVPLGIYSAAGKDSTKFYNRWLKKWGEAPVILDEDKVVTSRNNLLTAMQNRGYLDALVTTEKQTEGKRAVVNYTVTPQRRYVIRNVSHNILDQRIDSLLNAHGMKQGGGMQRGRPFSVGGLQDERKRIASFLNNHGYMYFNKEAVTFSVDSCRNTAEVDVTMHIGLFRQSSSEEFRDHPYYVINEVHHHAAKGQEMKLRPRILDINTIIRNGVEYNAAKVQKTYNKFSKLQAVRTTNVRFRDVTDSVRAVRERDSITGGVSGVSVSSIARLLDADIFVTRNKPHSIRVQPEGTNTAGDFGAALSVTYENRNLFHGSEVLSIQGRGAFEAIDGLEGYSRSNYQEYSAEAKLTFPEFLIPNVSRQFLRRHNATSELFVRYNWQNRPEFSRRVFTAGWRYKWESSTGRVRYTYDFIDVDYVSMPWISDTFRRDYLDSKDNRNAILRYNYENLLIMKMGAGMVYSDNLHTLKLNVEMAGNLLYGCSKLFNAPRNDMGQYKVADVAFAQYVKTDIDYTRMLRFDERNALALHARIGVGVPYGNSTMLPFEKRYFSGGANSVRGWSVRELGPGRYRGHDGRIDFINQTGDVKLDLNAELRTQLFWKFQGALFIDAGNVWTIRNYKDQPGGMLTWRNFYEGIAVAYGLGLRLNFDYFVLRLDLGMKAINPNYTTVKEHFPIANHRFGRDYALHFAVGMPF